MMNVENTEQSTILIVDDVPEELKALIVFLEDSGFRISAAHSGRAAIERIEHTQPDIILLDVLMPDMDGFETCRRLKERELSKDIPVIFMTALSETIDKVKGFEAGGVDYLAKPVQHEEVVARINTHLMIWKLQQQLQVQNALLAEQNERFRILSDATFEGILLHENGRIVEVNQTLEQMAGYRRADVLGKNVLEFITPEFRQNIAEHMAKRDDSRYEAEGIRQDGSTFPIEIQGRTLPYQQREIRIVAVRDLSWRRALEEETQQLLKASVRDRYKFGQIIGKSPVMQTVYEQIVHAANSDTNVLIYGESGTGKELTAQTIHQQGTRQDQPFIAVNCGAVPETLFEREFFGHRKGAFTSATKDQPGYFDRAHKGTLFLDEVGELSPVLQVKLLRVLDDREYFPLGDTRSKKVDVRIIAATNKDLRDLLRAGSIREDFFYRIRVMVINLPPLRERKEDILLLIDAFLKQYGHDEECSTLPAQIVEVLCAYHWPGNVRELQNELQRYLAEQRLEFIGNHHPESESSVFTLRTERSDLELRQALEIFEKQYINSILERNQGHRGKTAHMLGLPRRTLSRKMQKYQITFPHLES